MLLACDPQMLRSVTRARMAALRSCGVAPSVKDLAAKAAGPAHGADQWPDDWKWLLGVSTTEYNGGRTLVIRIDGALGYGMDAGWEFGVRTELVAKAIALAADKRRMARASNVPGPELVVLDINSPGGMVAGWSDLVGAVRACKAAGVRIEALAHDMACSGAMMLSLLCDRVYLTGTAMVGSLGVLFEHYDVHRMLDDEGISIEPIVSDGSEKKREGAGYAPLSDEARQHFKTRANDIAAQIIADIAEVGNRNAAAVRAIFDGRVYEARGAMAWANSAGRMIDGIVDPQAFFDSIGRGEEPGLLNIQPESEIDMSANGNNSNGVNPPTAAATAAQIRTAMGDRFDAAVAFSYQEKGLSVDAVIKEEAARGGDLLKQAEAKASAAEAKVAELTAELAKATAANAEWTAKAEAMGKQVDELKAKAEAAGMKLDVLGNKVVKAVAPVATGAGGKPAGGAGGVGGVGNDSAVAFEEAVEAHMASAKCNRQVAVFAMSTKHPAAFAEWQKARKG